jgi:hypothetical protein
VLLHVLRHVEADELDAENLRQLPRQLGLADTRGSGKQEVADRFVGRSQPRARQLDRRGHFVDGGVLSEDDAFERAVQVGERALVVTGDGLHGYPRHLGDDLLDVGSGDLIGAPGFDLGLAGLVGPAQAGHYVRRRIGRSVRREPDLDWLQLLRRSRLVDDVDRLVGQVEVLQVLRRQRHRGLQRRVGVSHPVMRFVVATQALENLQRLGL